MQNAVRVLGGPGGPRYELTCLSSLTADDKEFVGERIPSLAPRERHSGWGKRRSSTVSATGGSEEMVSRLGMIVDDSTDRVEPETTMEDSRPFVNSVSLPSRSW